MKKIIIYLGILFFSIGFIGCLDDKTTPAHIDISEITIDFVDDTLLTLGAGQLLELDATDFVTQTKPDEPLEYTWSGGVITKEENGEITVDSLQILSKEATLSHVFKDLKKHRLRLKVANRDYAVFKYFSVQVTSEFDEGLVMLSKNEAGQAMFSVLNGINESYIAGKTVDDFWYLTGEGEPVLDQDIVDFNYYNGRRDPMRGNHLYLLSGQNKKAYLLDQYSLTVANEFSLSKTPKMLALMNHSNQILDLYTYTEDGDVIAFCGKYLAEMGRTSFDSLHYWDDAKILKARYSDASYSTNTDMLYLFDDQNSKLYGMVAGDLSTAKDYWHGPGHFPGYEIVNVAFKEFSGSMSRNKYDVFIILREKANRQKIRIIQYNYVYRIAQYMGEGYQAVDTVDYELAPGQDIAVSRASKIWCHRYGQNTYSILFSSKHKLYRWYSNNKLPLTETTTPQDVYDIRKHAGPNAEIVDFDLDPTQMYIYVAVYDPDAPDDRKGSIYQVYAFDFSTEAYNKQWKNVGYKPMKLFYKGNRDRTYTW